MTKLRPLKLLTVHRQHEVRVRDDLEQFLVVEPFRAFRIIMTSGSTYDVRSPYQVIVEGLRVTYLFERSDREALLSLIEIAVLETVEDDQFR